MTSRHVFYTEGLPEEVASWGASSSEEVSLIVGLGADGRWFATVPECPGVCAYGASQDAAVHSVTRMLVDVVRGELVAGGAR
jgi:hypothetical protein